MLANAVKELQAAKQQITAQISGLVAEANKIDQAIAALSGLSVGSAAAPVVAGKRTMSPAHRKAVIKAQKARWAKIKATKTAASKPAKAAKPAKKRKQMSPLGKLKIKLGSLNRYGKTEEAAKVQAQIAELTATTATV